MTRPSASCVEIKKDRGLSSSSPPPCGPLSLSQRSAQPRVPSWLKKVILLPSPGSGPSPQSHGRLCFCPLAKTDQTLHLDVVPFLVPPFGLLDIGYTPPPFCLCAIISTPQRRGFVESRVYRRLPIRDPAPASSHGVLVSTPTRKASRKRKGFETAAIAPLRFPRRLSTRQPRD